MNLNKSLIVLLASMLIPFSLQAEEIEAGSIAVIDVEVAIYGTEASKQAFEELQASKEWKEVEEEKNEPKTHSSQSDKKSDSDDEKSTRQKVEGVDESLDNILQELKDRGIGNTD